MYSFLNKILQKLFSEKELSPELDTELRDIVYVAGPYAGDVKNNTDKAVRVGCIATELKLASFVPHTCIYMNVYGKDEIPEERQNGIVSTLSIVSHLASIESSHLWVIQNEDGTLSSGTESELIIWREIKKDLKIPENVLIKKYKDWIDDE